MDLTEKKIEGKMVYNGVIINVRMDQVELPNGKTAPREIADHPGAVAVLPLDEDNNVIMVTQYRYAFEEEMLEIPAGKLNPGEDPWVCALRELKEETGYVPGEMLPLGVSYSSPGFCTEGIYLFLARYLEPGEATPDEDEFLRTEKVPLDELVERILRDEIRDSKTIIAALKTKMMLERY